jgi:uncharacterized membrane protein YgaE (UPF0421/DUF939 family)
MNLDSFLMAVKMGVVAFLGYVCGSQFTKLFHDPSAEIGGFWSLIAGVVVLQATRVSTISQASLRVLGTLVGAAIAAVYLSFLPFTPLGMAVSIFATVLLCQLGRIADHARLASLTVAIMMVLAAAHSTLTPVMSALLRVCEACIGTAIALIVAHVSPEPKSAPKPAAGSGPAPPR